MGILKQEKLSNISQENLQDWVVKKGGKFVVPQIHKFIESRHLFSPVA